MTSMTQAELLATLTERFGKDPSGWAFICPSCEDIATVADFRAALAANPRKRKDEAVIASDILGQECIGRSLGALSVAAGTWTGRGCDWAAYGLIPGPLTITTADGKTFQGFNIAPAPAEATA